MEAINIVQIFHQLQQPVPGKGNWNRTTKLYERPPSMFFENRSYQFVNTLYIRIRQKMKVVKSLVSCSVGKLNIFGVQFERANCLISQSVGDGTPAARARLALG